MQEITLSYKHHKIRTRIEISLKQMAVYVGGPHFQQKTELYTILKFVAKY